MKIALIIEHFDPSRGGAEQFTVWLAGVLFLLDDADCGTAANALPATANATTSTRVLAM